MSFSKKLSTAIHQKQSSLCVGIDPHLDQIHGFFKEYFEKHGAIKMVKNFSESLILGSKPYAAAVKFQSSFFEALGWQGVKLLQEQITFAKEQGLITILDAKRGDISSTMLAYGKSAYDVMNADCLTITPYMGLDVIDPLVPWLKKGKGAYVVWVTSNPSGTQLQNFSNQENLSVSEWLLDKILSTYEESVLDSLGVVLGATKLEDFDSQLLKKASRLSILAPGIGFQGGMITNEFKKILKQNKHLIPISRGIAGLGDPTKANQFEAMRHWDDYKEFVMFQCKESMQIFS